MTSDLQQDHDTRILPILGKGTPLSKRKSVPVVTAVPVAAMVPAMMPMPSAVTVPAVMAAPMHLRGDVLRRMLRRGRGHRIDQRYCLRAINRRSNREQPGNGCESEDRPDVHLHECSPLISERKPTPKHGVPTQRRISLKPD